MRKSIWSWSLGMVLLFCASGYAQNECSKELLLAYFPEVFVGETLQKFDVPQDEWSEIQRSLAHQGNHVIKLVEEKAQKMNPNPLKDPQDRKVAIALFKETLLQIFSEVMKEHGITDEEKIQAMLTDIQRRKATRFTKCMQKSGEK